MNNVAAERRECENKQDAMFLRRYAFLFYHTSAFYTSGPQRSIKFKPLKMFATSAATPGQGSHKRNSKNPLNSTKKSLKSLNLWWCSIKSECKW